MYFPQHKESFKALLAQLKGKKVAVLGHMRPDGDCVGSQVGLCRALNQSGIEAIAINQDPIPQTLKPFIGDTPWGTHEGFDAKDYVAITVDCADDLRTGGKTQALFPQKLANIDHHISNTGYAQQNFIEAHTAATAEILAGLFLDHGLPIDAVTAQALYVGIATDTGQFRFPSTSPQVFEICSALINAGANPGQAAKSLYENESFNKLELLKTFLSSLKLECNGRVCIGILTREDYQKSGALREDSEGLVDYARSIAGVDIGVLIEERENGMLKGSFRAKETHYRVDQLAKVYGGGGHACAAGLSQDASTAQAFYPILLKSIEAHLVQVDSGSA